MGFYSQATVGQASAGFSSFDNSGLNTDNEIGLLNVAVASPIAGRIRTLAAFFGGDGVSVNAILVGWDSVAFTPDAKSPQFSAPSGSHSTGGQTLNIQNTDGTAPVIGQGRSQYFGWWRDASSSAVWSVRGTGSFRRATSASLGNAPGSVCGGAYVCGDIQAFGIVIGIPFSKDGHFQGMSMYKKSAFGLGRKGGL